RLDRLWARFRSRPGDECGLRHALGQTAQSHAVRKDSRRNVISGGNREFRLLLSKALQLQQDRFSLVVVAVASATASVATATVSASVSAAAATTALLTRTSFIHSQGATRQLAAVQGSDRLIGSAVHFDRRRPAAASGLPVGNDRGSGDLTKLTERIAQIVRRGAEGKVTHVNSLTHL